MPTTGNQPQFTLIGAGLGGALEAIYLARAGYRVEVHERRGDPRSGKIDAGRSINLAISVRGIEALRGAGGSLADEVLKSAVPMRGRMIHAVSGELSYQPYAVDGTQAINSVSRAALNVALIDAARRLPNVAFHFDHKCVAVDLQAGRATFQNTRTGEAAQSCGGVLVGADGAFSPVRTAMQKTERFDYSQSYLAHGYKELSIPPDDAGRHRMEKNALHIWPRRSFMMIALPNIDGSFTCTLFWPFEGRHSADTVRTGEQVLAFFREVFPDAVPLMPTLVEDFQANPNPPLVTIRCGPWYHEDRAVLLGDAAHAVVPFYGQGANAAFEDCPVLCECIEKYAPDLRRAFDEFYRRRKENTDALADLALHNFVEMRDHTGKRSFLLKKKAEKWLARLLPGWYVPLYSMVSFSRTPYAEAVRRASRQNRMVQGAAAIAGVLLLWAFLVWWIERLMAGGT